MIGIIIEDKYARIINLKDFRVAILKPIKHVIIAFSVPSIPSGSNGTLVRVYLTLIQILYLKYKAILLIKSLPD